MVCRSKLDEKRRGRAGEGISVPTKIPDADTPADRRASAETGSNPPANRFHGVYQEKEGNIGRKRGP